MYCIPTPDPPPSKRDVAPRSSSSEQFSIREHERIEMEMVIPISQEQKQQRMKL